MSFLVDVGWGLKFAPAGENEDEGQEPAAAAAGGGGAAGGLPRGGAAARGEGGSSHICAAHAHETPMPTYLPLPTYLRIMLS